MLVDVHCHLDSDKFTEDLNEVLERAKREKVKIVISGVNTSTNRKILEIKEKHPEVEISFGIYPLDALKNEPESINYSRDIENFDLDLELDFIEKNKDKCIAIGECGLDFKYSDKKQEQEETFKKIIQLSKKINKPLIIHSRKAEAEAVDILEKEKCKKVLLHCFNGKRSLIKKATELGYFFSIPPVIVRLEHFQMLAEIVPLTQILTETDSPYLSHIQGERNQPINVKITIKEIARIKNISEEQVENQIYENYKKLFT